MALEFKVNGKYTLISINAGAITVKYEIIIFGKDERTGQRYFKHKRKKTKYFMPSNEELNKKLLFQGHDLPLIVDTDTDNWEGGANFNFVTDDPEILREFLISKCLNPTPETFRKIFYFPTKRGINDSAEGIPLFTKLPSIF